MRKVTYKTVDPFYAARIRVSFQCQVIILSYMNMLVQLFTTVICIMLCIVTISTYMYTYIVKVKKQYSRKNELSFGNISKLALWIQIRLSHSRDNLKRVNIDIEYNLTILSRNNIYEQKWVVCGIILMVANICFIMGLKLTCKCVIHYQPVYGLNQRTTTNPCEKITVTDASGRRALVSKLELIIYYLFISRDNTEDSDDTVFCETVSPESSELNNIRQKYVNSDLVAYTLCMRGEHMQVNLGKESRVYALLIIVQNEMRYTSAAPFSEALLYYMFMINMYSCKYVYCIHASRDNVPFVTSLHKGHGDLPLFTFMVRFNTE